MEKFAHVWSLFKLQRQTINRIDTQLYLCLESIMQILLRIYIRLNLEASKSSLCLNQAFVYRWIVHLRITQIIILLSSLKSMSLLHFSSFYVWHPVVYLKILTKQVFKTKIKTIEFQIMSWKYYIL